MNPHRSRNTSKAAVVVATALALWGIVHIIGGASLLPIDTFDALETLGPDATASVPADPGATTEAVVRFHALNIALGSVAVTLLSVFWWRQRRSWQVDVALTVAIGLDVGLIVFMVGPGLLPPTEGLIGPTPVAAALAGRVLSRTRPQTVPAAP